MQDQGSERPAHPVSPHEMHRRARGWTQKQLAAACGFTPAYVSQIEVGRTKPSRRYRERAADVLGLPEGVLFPESGGL